MAKISCISLLGKSWYKWNVSWFQEIPATWQHSRIGSRISHTEKAIIASTYTHPILYYLLWPCEYLYYIYTSGPQALFRFSNFFSFISFFSLYLYKYIFKFVYMMNCVKAWRKVHSDTMNGRQRIVWSVLGKFKHEFQSTPNFTRFFQNVLDK